MSIRAKDIKWLRLCSGDDGGMYPGVHAELVPVAPRDRLMKAGLIETYEPHNPIHKIRFTATYRGRMVLATSPPSHAGDGRG